MIVTTAFNCNSSIEAFNASTTNFTSSTERFAFSFASFAFSKFSLRAVFEASVYLFSKFSSRIFSSAALIATSNVVSSRVTTTVHCAFFSGFIVEVAVIIAVPALLAVTNPVALSTEAIPSASDTQRTSWLALSGATIAVNCTVSPTFKLASVTFNVTSVTGTYSCNPAIACSNAVIFCSTTTISGTSGRIASCNADRASLTACLEASV